MDNPGNAGFWLSPQQKHVWSLQQAYGVHRSVSLSVIEGFQAGARIPDALQHMVTRHEILRTRFVRQPGMVFPFQVIDARADTVFETTDLSHLSGTDQGSALAELFRAEQFRESVPELSSTLVAKLVNLGAARSALLLSLPSMAADSRSLRILVKEILQFSAGENADADDEPLRYVQFSQWQNDLLTGDDENASKGRDFWTRYGNTDSALSIPNERRSTGSFSKRVFERKVDSAILRNIEAHGTALKASRAEILLAAWQCLLWRLTGQSRFSTGVVFEGREYDELAELVGLVAKTIPIPARFDADYRFREVVEHTHNSVADVAEWQEYYLPGSGFSAGPPVSFEYLSSPVLRAASAVSISRRYTCDWHDAYKLKLLVLEEGDGLTLEFHFDESRFELDFVERLAGYFRRLLAAAILDPEALVARLPLLDEVEYRRLVFDWNQTYTEYPHEKCFHELFEEQALLTPERPAVRFGEYVVKYRQLNERANQLAHFLRVSGVRADSLVGLCVDRSAEMMVGLLAILKAGGAYVPLNPDNPRPRISHQLSGVLALITEEKLLDRIPSSFVGNVVCLDRDQHQWAELARDGVKCAATPDSIAYVIYTSGSTGVPKGVAVRHRNLVNYSYFITQRLQLEQYSQGLNFATVSTIGADLGNTCIFPALISGGCVHVIGYDDSTDPQRFAHYAIQHPIDVLKIVPSHLQALLHSSYANRILPRKFLILGGETLNTQLVEKIESLGANCSILNHYGPTETTIGSMTLRLADFDWKSSTATSIPIGRPIANTQVYLLDRILQPVPTGAVGELYIAGDGVTAGYLNQPDRTAERFLQNPFAADPEAKMYRTGDLARHLSGGEIEFLGRSDDQIKIRGFRIELGEIESVLLRFPGVKQSVVLAKDDERGEKRLIAYIVADRDVTVDGLRIHLKAELPDFMVPSAIVLLPKIPLTSNGKIDRQALPEPEAIEIKAFVAPKTETEVIVSKIFAEVLRLDRISTDDNFFDLGGHSLLATQVVSRIREQFRVELPIRALFETPTVSGLATGIVNSESLPASQEPTIMRVSREAYRVNRS